MNEMRFCINVVVTGKGNLEKTGYSITIFQRAGATVEAHLYVPANTSQIVSRGRRGEKVEGGRRNAAGLHERANLLTTSKAESALTAAIARSALIN